MSVDDEVLVIVDVTCPQELHRRRTATPLPVLDDINLELRDGEIVALLGRSGSGKSTLLRCIAGLIAPTSGTVRYRGEPAQRRQPRRGDGVPDASPCCRG